MKEIPPTRESLTLKVHEAIRNAIILGDLTPGSLHSVQELAAVLNVSRTPIREALLKLADQGMVRFERNRGARILQTTIHDLEEIFSLRLLLEVPATLRATEQIRAAELRRLGRSLDAFRRAITTANVRQHLELDATFHRIIMLASGNQRLAAFVDSLRDLQVMRGASTAPRARSLKDICHDHERIYRQMVSGNAIGAAMAMRDHIALTSRLLLAQETGDVESAAKFESTWIDLFDLRRQTGGLRSDRATIATSSDGARGGMPAQQVRTSGTRRVPTRDRGATRK